MTIVGDVYRKTKKWSGAENDLGFLPQTWSQWQRKKITAVKQWGCGCGNQLFCATSMDKHRHIITMTSKADGREHLPMASLMSNYQCSCSVTEFTWVVRRGRGGAGFFIPFENVLAEKACSSGAFLHNYKENSSMEHEHYHWSPLINIASSLSVH